MAGEAKSLRSRRRLQLAAWGPVVTYMAIIFTLSAQPTLPPLPGFMVVDKAQHAVAYLGLTLFAFRAARLSPLLFRAGAYLQSFVIAAFYGATDEWHQSFVSGRACEFVDWLADLFGALMGLALMGAIQHICERREMR